MILFIATSVAQHPLALELEMRTRFSTQEITTALAKAENRAFLVRHAQKMWLNLWDHRIELKIRIAGLIGSLATGATIYIIFPLDWITNLATLFFVSVLGPFAVLLLADNVVATILLGILFFNKWADWYRRDLPSE